MQINRIKYTPAASTNNNSLLSYKLAADERISPFYEGMFRNNGINGVAAVSVVRNTDGCELHFDVHGMVPLTALSSMPLKRGYMLTLLANIGDAILEARRFMLSENSFILAPEFIFLDTQTLNIALIYDATYNKHTYSYCTFAKQWTLEGNFDLTEDGAYPTMIISRINAMKPDTDISELVAYFRELLNSAPQAQMQAPPPTTAQTTATGSDDNMTVFADTSQPCAPEQQSPRARTAYLVDSTGGRITIDKPKFQIGKGRATATPNDYIIPNAGISRAHALIERTENGAYHIIDLYSLNGTFVNGTRLISNEKRRLNSGDTVIFANVQYTFRID